VLYRLGGLPDFVRRELYISVVTLSDVTAIGVRAAVAEFDRLGRDAFLRSTGFGRARAYYLEHDGRLYDSKAIVGYAHGISAGTPLGPGDFSGGDKTVAQRLAALGFKVLNVPNPDWTRDEIILACALVESNGWKQLDARDPRVHTLSGLLQSAAIHPATPRNPDFRNPAGVAMKTFNIASTHPAYRGAPSNGNRLDKEVLDDFLDDPARMHAMAARIRELLTRDEAANGDLPDLDRADMAAGEGGLALRAHLRRERDPRLRRKKLADTKRRGLPISCEVCTFDFSRTYGSHGIDYIECHHRTPLHVTGETQTRLRDLALVCSNCHRMIHRTKQWLTVEELQNLVATQRKRLEHEVPGGADTGATA
jgi:5-methylcytosine-specific restriction enzyme A